MISEADYGRTDRAGDTKRKKWEHFKEYYLRTVLLCTALIIGVMYLFYTSFWGYQETVVDVLFVESKDLDLEGLRRELKEFLHLEEEELAVEQLSTDAALSQTILPARIAAGDIDLFLADREVLLEYAGKGIMEDLEEVLPQRLYKDVEARLVYVPIKKTDVHGKVTETGEERPYGISLKGLESMAGPLEAMPDLVLGIIKGPDDLEMELEVIRYFVN